MKNLATVLVTLLILLGCATESLRQEGPKADVLILSPQGVNPAVDTVGFNGLVRKVTQAFAGKLSSALQERNASFINVIDQNPKYDVGEKLALYSVKYSSRSAIVLTIETETLGSDRQILLMAQYIDQDFVVEGGKIHGVKPTSTLKKSYLLRSSITGDNPSTMTDLANDYMGFLKEQGRI